MSRVAVWRIRQAIPWALAGGLLVAGACQDKPDGPIGPDGGSTPWVPLEPAVEPDLPPAPSVSLTSPMRIAWTPQRRLLVSDYYARAVFLVDPATLQPVGAFAVDGAPLAVGLGGARIFVGNATTATVDVFDHRGEYQYSFGSGRGAVGDPKDLVVDSARGLVLVVDGKSRVVRLFTVDGEAKSLISGFGPGPQRLQNPTALALRDGQLYVSDYGDLQSGEPARIKVFDSAGNFVSSISGAANPRGVRFARPQGLTVASARNVFVTEAMSGEVLVLDLEADAVTRTIGTWGSDPGQLRLPLDAVVDPGSGDVFVTNSRNARVERFAGAGLP